MTASDIAEIKIEANREERAVEGSTVGDPDAEGDAEDKMLALDHLANAMQLLDAEAAGSNLPRVATCQGQASQGLIHHGLLISQEMLF